jgi:hypothetical protein
MIRRSAIAAVTACSALIAVPAAHAATEPTIANLTASAPSAEYAYEPGLSPGMRLARLDFTVTSWGDCDRGAGAPMYRYANEDGNWVDEYRDLQRPYINRDPSPGYKGVYVQLLANCGTGTARPVGNVLFARYTMPNPPTATEPAEPAAQARIVKASIALPNPAYVNDPMRMPSERLPHVSFDQVDAPANCSFSSFRYAREDEAWVDSVSRTRPLVHLTPGAGERSIYVQLEGTCGEASATSDVVKLTTVVPVYPGDPAGSVRIDSLAVPATTTTSEVTVDLRYSNGSGCTQMRLATEDGNWRAWQPCTTWTSFASSPGLGIKGVYVQLKGVDGSLSNIAFTKYRVVAGGGTTPPPAPSTPDRTAPVLRGALVPSSVTSRSVVVTIDATDDVGVSQVRFANEDGTWGPWQAFAPAMNHQLSAGTGYKGVYVQVRDAARNESLVTFTKLTLR